MNRQARAVIDEFSSPENKRLLFDVLNNHFNRPFVFGLFALTIGVK